MTEPQQYRGSARDAHAAFVASQLSDAISQEKGGKHADAMMALGVGAHAVMDEFGAAHGFNEWSYDQCGLRKLLPADSGNYCRLS